MLRAALPLLALLLCGCSSVHRQAAVPNGGLLDDELGSAVYADAIKQAERYLQADEWADKPWRHNVSRFHRESAVARSMLADIAPRLKQMSVTALVRSLKVTSRYAPDDFFGVAGCLFEGGNAMIIDEIKSRPSSELAVLSGLASEQVIVWEGIQGPGDSLAFLIHFRILKDQ